MQIIIPLLIHSSKLLLLLKFKNHSNSEISLSLSLSLSPRMRKGIMEVTLVGAKGLRRADFLGKIDTYVVLQYHNQQHTSSIARGQGSKPVWNEKFDFVVEYPARDHDTNYELFLQFMDRDTFTADDYLGQTKIYLKHLFELGVEEGKAELGTQKYRVVLKDQKYHGEVQLGITFTLE